MEPQQPNSCFEYALNLEQTHHDQGYEEGYTHGIAAGKQDGSEVGLKTGFEVGEELGFTEDYRFMELRDQARPDPILDPGSDISSMSKLMLACCKVYISESRNISALRSIEQAAKLFPEAAIVNKFEDVTYNRVGYTLVSRLTERPSFDSCPLRGAVFAMVKAATDNIDLELHSGSHPRLGVVDHICFHPLARSSLDQVAGIAKSLAADIGFKLQVPTFLYGAAHEDRRTLDSIRRELNYFKPNSTGSHWVGGLNSESLPLNPDAGPAQVTRAKGIIVIGATQWVDNYNVPVYSRDISTVRRVAKLVSGRGGGLPSVQAMALAHGEGIIEVACNLLEPTKVEGNMVQLEVERLAEEEGLSVGKGYFTNLSQDNIIEIYTNFGF